jgi:hypothetical protein
MLAHIHCYAVRVHGSAGSDQAFSKSLIPGVHWKGTTEAGMPVPLSNGRLMASAIVCHPGLLGPPEWLRKVVAH